jgi:hypothetical protein
VIAGLLRRVTLMFQVVRQLSLEHSFCKRFFQLAEQAGICPHCMLENMLDIYQHVE